MALTDSIPEPLQKQIGPFPLWVWMGGIGGGLLLFVLVNRGDGGESGNAEPAEPFEFDEFDTASGPTLDDTSGGNGGDSGTGTPTEDKPDLKAKCPPGFRAVRSKNDRRWVCKKVPKPKCKKGFHAKWKNGSWVCVKNKSFTLEEPHIDMMEAPNGGPPTLTTQNIPAIGIAAPDKTPRAKLEPLNSTEPYDPNPVIAPSVPPRPMFRSPGRPFHGANR